MTLKRIFLLCLFTILLTPLGGQCDSQDGLNGSEAISKLKEVRIEGIEVSSVTTEEGRIRIEGNAGNNKQIADFLKAIQERNVGNPELGEIRPIMLEGRRFSHFVVLLTPRASDTGRKASAPPEAESEAFVQHVANQVSTKRNLSFGKRGRLG